MKQKVDNPKPQEGQILHLLFRQIFEEKNEMLQNLHFPGESQHPQRILGLEGHLKNLFNCKEAFAQSCR